MFPSNLVRQMKIQVRAAAHIAKIFDSRKTYIELPEPSTLGGLLNELTRIYGQEFYDAACTEDGYSPKHVAILVNGSSAAAIGGVDIKLKDGDDVLFLPTISGG